MNILDTIVERTKERIREEKREIPPEEMRDWAEAADRGEKESLPEFERALRRKGLSFICEVKKAFALQRADRPGVPISRNCRGTMKRRGRRLFPA